MEKEEATSEYVGTPPVLPFSDGTEAYRHNEVGQLNVQLK